MTLKLNKVREVVKVRIRAICHQAESSGSPVTVLFCPISQWWKIGKSDPV